MAVRARGLFRRMLEQTHLSQYAMGALLGWAEKTVWNYANGAGIPSSTAEWLGRVESITVEAGRATIVVQLPHAKQSGEYRREPLQK